jgi:Zn-finger nucleic acid-binding protein
VNRCPRDHELLASNDVSGFRYYSCQRCGGYWIPGAILHRVLSARGVEELRALPSAGRSELQCPDGLGDCESVVIEGSTLDWCGVCHGIWLDRGEVTKVRRLFPDGSAVVDADESVVSPRTRKLVGAAAILEFVAQVLLAAIDF